MTNDINYIYLEVSPNIDANLLKRILKKIFSDIKYEVEYQNKFISLALYGGKKSLVIFQTSLAALNEDLDINMKGLVVPFFNSRFAKYLNYVNKNEISYLFEISSDHKEIYTENIDLLDMVDDYTLRTLKAYIETGNSPSLAAYKLYVHRNTVTYRIDRFSQTFNVDLSQFPNCVFIYMLIKEKLAKMI